LAGLGEMYCVIGIRADGSRHVLSMNLSLDDANYLKRVLLEAEIFPAVLIDHGEPAVEAEDPPRSVGGDVERCA
jgi:hypothetical protein